ncbi:MAG: decaprenyl-phosphate phosphoribosyltransferase [Nitriliruptorales bacterium]
MTSPADGVDETFVARPNVSARSSFSGAVRLIVGLVRTARPRQWAKNVLVFAAPAAAGVLLQPRSLARTLGAFGIFCLAASGVYFFNDIADVVEDRRHPRKRFRPIAAGIVPIRLATVLALGMLLSSVVGGWLTLGSPFAAVVGGYVVLTIAYSLRLKHIAIVDLAGVAAGFVLRAIAGGVATGVPISSWFLIVASFGSLFMVAGKRHAEHADLGDNRVETRLVLAEYSLAYLRYIRFIASSVTIVAYCLWAFQEAAEGGGVWSELSIVPFVLGILRYALLLEAGHGEAPEQIVLSDRPLQVFGVLWVITFLGGVYVG